MALQLHLFLSASVLPLIAAVDWGGVGWWCAAEPVADLWADGPSSTSQQLDWAVPVPAPALLKAARRQQQQQEEAAAAAAAAAREGLATLRSL